MIETAAALRGSHHYIEKPVIVVIKNGDPAAGAGLVESDLRCDLFEFNPWFFKTGFDFHAELKRNKVGVTAEFYRRLPEHGKRPQIVGISFERIHTSLCGAFSATGTVERHTRVIHCCRVQRRTARNLSELQFSFFVKPALHQSIAQFEAHGIVFWRMLQPCAAPFHDFPVFKAHKNLDLSEHGKEVFDQAGHFFRPCHIEGHKASERGLSKQSAEGKRDLNRQREGARTCHIQIAERFSRRRQNFARGR